MDQRTNSSQWTMLGAVGAALAASLCCILPVVAAVLGVAGFAAAAFFAAWRPYFLALTFTLLGVAFYLAYRRRAAVCEPDTLCARDRFVRTSRVALWAVTVLVTVLASFPYYSGALVRAFGREPRAPQTGSVSTTQAVLTIQGMNCSACAALIEKKLAQIPGVQHTTVSFETKQATVEYNRRAVAPERFVKVIERAGYKVAPTRSQGKK